MIKIEDSGIYSTAVGEVDGLKIIMNLPKKVNKPYEGMEENEAVEDEQEENKTAQNKPDEHKAAEYVLGRTVALEALKYTPLRLFNEMLDLAGKGELDIYEGNVFVSRKIGEENKGKELCGGILVKPLISGKHDDSLQFIPLYKEEISFAERLGSRKLRNMFKYFAPEEINEARPDRYNIITDIDGRRNCF
jgi:hypothetical protein